MATRQRISFLCRKRSRGHVDAGRAHRSEAHPPELVDLVHEHNDDSLIGLYGWQRLS
jgi:hypothetical protein